MATLLMNRPGSLLRHWWVLVVRGILAVLFGIFAITWPGMTLAILLALFGAFALIDGITSIVSAVRQKDWGWQFWGGLLSVVIGVLTFVWPLSTGLALLLLIAAWAIWRGVTEIGVAIALRHELKGSYEWLLILTGIISILFGFLIALRPVVGLLAIVGIIAACAIFLGVMLIAAGLRMRGLEQRLPGRAGQVT